MDVQVALFRGMNVGGTRRLAMAELRAALEGAGLGPVRTHVQSGNAVFRARGTPEALAARIRSALEAATGVTAELVVLPAAELEWMLAENPFPEAAAQPAGLHLFVLDGPVPDLSAFAPLRAGDERLAAAPRGVWLHAPSGLGRSKLAAALGRRLPGVATARNLRSLEAIAALAREI
ncbi:DUF1697 domain-containing protein [Oceanicella sp. SM1341]|uniref:DUF1697 domain-containing protein n=1 Tax=Oceanicella sp. SM1341 TaxID=1548889 RepID=UPI0013008A33|nr:DUF1697 domain-containing protein [Oceanicella sp. SM1341]